MSPIRSSLFLGAGAAASSYQIERSLRCNSSDSAYLSRTPASAGNRKTWTWAGWVKRSGLGSTGIFGAGGSGDTDYFGVSFDSSNKFSIGGNLTNFLITTQVFRDFSAWMHIVVALDTTQGTASNTLKIYVNGVLVTAYDTDNRASKTSSSVDLGFNRASLQGIGCLINSVGNPATYNNCYLADIYFIDGQALTPSSFTEVSATTGQLIPKTYSGTYGTNGFQLKFADNSTAAALGTDTSGNSNNWTPNNFSVVAGNGNFARYVYAGNATYNGSETGTSYYTGAGSQYNGFDGNTSTYVGGQNVGASWVYFRPGTAISGVSQVRVYTAYVEQIYINGSLVSLSPSAPSTTAQWYSVTSPASTINEIAVQGRVADNSAGRFSAIEINGVVLVDNSFGSGNDSLVDTPTSYGTDDSLGGSVRGNYATLNPLYNTSTTPTLSNGNLDYSMASADGTGLSGRIATIANLSSGKWYFEVTKNSGTGDFFLGWANPSWNPTINPDGNSNAWAVRGATQAYKTNGGTSTQIFSSYADGDVFMIAVDIDAAKIWLGKNGTWAESGAPASGTNAQFTNLTGSPYSPFVRGAGGGGGISLSCNFGQRAFAYTAPSGFKALCDTNLPSPVVAKGSSVMDVKLYTGNGSTQTISGLGFSPDLVWIKARSTSSYNHFLLDTIRGVNNELNSNTTDFEYTRPAPGSLTAFNSDGFNLNTAIGVNASSTTYAAWCWDAGTSTVTNTQGSITSQVRANVSAGFSVVTWTSPSSGDYTIGHGLGVAPSLVITKSRSASGDQWYTFHRSVCTSTSNYLKLSSTDGLSTYAGAWGATLPTSTVVGLNAGGGFIPSSATAVAYCFAPVSGYSSFGSYTGNGSENGPFVYTGFRPRWILLKDSTNAGNWELIDTARLGYNGANYRLYPNLSEAETADNRVDILSNGFKIRTGAGTAINSSNAVIVYACFAESPFAYSRAR